MALKLKLKPHEKAIINGAVIENGSRAAEIIVRNVAHILREPSVMQQDEAITPARRTYFAIQLMLMDPPNSAAYGQTAEALAGDLRAALMKPEVIAQLDEAVAAMRDGNYYKALQALKDVMAYEAEVLGVPPFRSTDAGADAAAKKKG